jgi:hypothetical protein
MDIWKKRRTREEERIAYHVEDDAAVEEVEQFADEEREGGEGLEILQPLLYEQHWHLYFYQYPTYVHTSYRERDARVC